MARQRLTSGPNQGRAAARALGCRQSDGGRLALPTSSRSDPSRISLGTARSSRLLTRWQPIPADRSRVNRHTGGPSPAAPPCELAGRAVRVVGPTVRSPEATRGRSARQPALEGAARRPPSGRPGSPVNGNRRAKRAGCAGAHPVRRFTRSTCVPAAWFTRARRTRPMRSQRTQEPDRPWDGRAPRRWCRSTGLVDALQPLHPQVRWERARRVGRHQ